MAGWWEKETTNGQKEDNKRLGEGESAVWQVFLEEEGSKGSGHGFQHSRQTGLWSECLGLFLQSAV